MLVAGIVANFIFATLAQGLEEGFGRYQYKDRETDKTLNVWYYKPAEYSPQTPVVIILHGMLRNGEAYCKSWSRHAKAKKFMLLAPEFSNVNFPGLNSYHYGNYMRSNGRINPREKWSFMVVERVFDDFIKAREKTEAGQYYLYGHSAGGHVVHRLMLCVPEARVKLGISANAGVFTMLDFETPWPYGLKRTGFAEDSVRRYLSAPMVVLMGEKDDDPNHHQLIKTAGANAQGNSRLARGRNFFASAQAAAKKLNVPLAWKMHIVPGVGHDDRLMSVAAVELLLADMKRADAANHAKAGGSGTAAAK